MKREYDEIMEHIQVTPEMRRRILRHIQEERISVPSSLRFPGLKGYLSAAACFVLLLAGAAALPRLMERSAPEPPPVVNAGYGIEEAASLQELAGLVGFVITEDFSLPFEPAETICASYWRELAQIEYRGENQSASFRQSPGTKDNSGDFTVYSSSVEITVGGCTVTLRGNDGTYTLALWTDGEFSFSLRLSAPASEREWCEILLP